MSVTITESEWRTAVSEAIPAVASDDSGVRRKQSGSVYRRGHVWWIAFYADGTLFRESSGSRYKHEARALLRSRIGDGSEWATGCPHLVRLGTTSKSRAINDKGLADKCRRILAEVPRGEWLDGKAIRRIVRGNGEAVYLALKQLHNQERVLVRGLGRKGDTRYFKVL